MSAMDEVAKLGKKLGLHMKENKQFIDTVERRLQDKLEAHTKTVCDAVTLAFRSSNPEESASSPKTLKPL